MILKEKERFTGVYVKIALLSCRGPSLDHFERMYVHVASKLVSDVPLMSGEFYTRRRWYARVSSLRDPSTRLRAL